MSTGADGRLRGDERTLAALGTAIGDWQRDAAAALTQAGAQLRAQAHAVERTRVQRASRLRALETALGACEPDSPERGRLMLDVRSAEQDLAQADSASQDVEDVATEFRMLERQARAILGAAAPAVTDLQRRRAAVDRYRAEAIPSAGGAPVGSGPVPGDSGNAALARRGLALVSLDRIDFRDNPIIDGYGKGDATRADYRWAVETWANQVEPEVQNGADRSFFETRDTERGAVGLRQTANVYDLFLGSDPVALSRRPDGTLDPQSGRHRIEVARELGLTHLPARLL